MRLIGLAVILTISLLRKSPVSRGSPLGSRFQNHTIPLAFEQLDRAACDSMGVAAVGVIGVGFMVRYWVGYEVHGGPERPSVDGLLAFPVSLMPTHAVE